MRTYCLSCEGTGIGKGMRANHGELLNLCQPCEGHGVVVAGEAVARDFVAIFAVSDRYVVHLYIPRHFEKGSFVQFEVQWSPRMPGKRGRSKLTHSEAKAYEAGRAAALAAVMDQRGGGGFSVVAIPAH